MQLQDGKLYETADGRRFRVTLCAATRYFECPQSYSGSWIDNGASYLRAEDNLIRLVPENRWISVCQNDDKEEGRIYRWERGHLQMQVTREEAKRMAPNYNPAVAPAASITAGVAGSVQTPNHNAWFNWAFSTENGTVYLNIETSKGAKLTFPL